MKMVQVTGQTKIVSKNYDGKDKFIYKKGKSTIEVINSTNVIDYDNIPAKELICNYTVLIDICDECKSLQDYTGKVFPHLKKILCKERVISNLSNNFSYTYEEQHGFRDIKSIISDAFI